MRRIIFVLALTLAGFLASGVVAPATRAQVTTATPVVTVTPSTVVAGSNATVTGTGFSHNTWAYVFWIRPNGTTNAAWVFASSTGTFTFTLEFAAANGLGTEWITAYDTGVGKWAAWVPIVVTATTPPTNRPT